MKRNEKQGAGSIKIEMRVVFTRGLSLQYSLTHHLTFGHSVGFRSTKPILKSSLRLLILSRFLITVDVLG